MLTPFCQFCSNPAYFPYAPAINGVEYSPLRSDGPRTDDHYAQHGLTYGDLPGVTLSLSNLSTLSSRKDGVTLRRNVLELSHLWEQGGLSSPQELNYSLR